MNIERPIDSRIKPALGYVITGMQARVDCALGTAELLDEEGFPANGLTPYSFTVLESLIRETVLYTFQRARITNFPFGTVADGQVLSRNILERTGAAQVLTIPRRRLLIEFDGIEPLLLSVNMPLDLRTEKEKYPGRNLLEVHVGKLIVEGRSPKN